MKRLKELCHEVSSNLKEQCLSIMRTRERHLFFLQKTIELSCWLDKISFRTAPGADGDLLFTFTPVTFLISKTFFVLSKIWLATGRLLAILSLAGPPYSLIPLALKTAFLMWNSCQRSINPRPVIFAWFARVLSVCTHTHIYCKRNTWFSNHFSSSTASTIWTPGTGARPNFCFRSAVTTGLVCRGSKSSHQEIRN